MKKNTDNEQEQMQSAQESFRTFVQNKYASFGPSSMMVFRTSRELIYDCREMCEPSLPDVAKVMDELKFKSDLFCGQYTWVLYEKEELRF